MTIAGVDRFDDGLERRRQKLARHPARRCVADAVTDPDLVEARDLGDLAGDGTRALDGAARLEHRERGDLALAVAAEPNAIADTERPGEDADIRDALTRRSALDLEDERRQWCRVVAAPRRQQVADPGQ
jgi:hypothetical protein